MPEFTTILHLSDLHLTSTAETNASQRALIRQFWKFIDQWDNLKIQTPDIICITGDLAAKGIPEEYGLNQKSKRGTVYSFVTRLIEKLNLPSTRVVIVPGNHDVNRELVNDILAKDQVNIVKSINEIDKFFFNETKQGHREEVFRRLRPFVEFYAALTDYELNDNEEESILNFLYNPLHLGKENGLPIDICFNRVCTSWLCQSYFHVNKNNEYFINDNFEEPRGTVAIGIHKLEDLYDEIWQKDKTALKVTLMHHPFDWISEAESSKAEHSLSNLSDIILTGHIHKSHIYTPRLGLKGHIIGAGAFFQNEDYQNSFNILRIESVDGLPKSCFLKSIQWHSQFDKWLELNFPYSLTAGHKQSGYELVDGWLKIPLRDAERTEDIPKVQISVTFTMRETLQNDDVILFLFRGLSNDSNIRLVKTDNYNNVQVYEIQRKNSKQFIENLTKNEDDFRSIFYVKKIKRINIGDYDFTYQESIPNSIIKNDIRSAKFSIKNLSGFEKGEGVFGTQTHFVINKILELQNAKDELLGQKQVSGNLTDKYEMLKADTKDDWSWYTYKRFKEDNTKLIDPENKLYILLNNQVKHGIKKVITVYGGTGHGKTTFLRHFFINYLPNLDPHLSKRLLVLRIALGTTGLSSESMEDDIDNKINKFLNQEFPELYNEDSMFEMAKMCQNIDNYFFETLLKEIKLGETKAEKLNWINSIVGRRSVQKECNNPFADFNRIRIQYLYQKHKLKFILILDNCDQMYRNMQEAAFILARHKLEWAHDTNNVAIIIAMRSYMIARASKELTMAAYQTRHEIPIHPPLLKDVLINRIPILEKYSQKSYLLHDESLKRMGTDRLNITQETILVLLKKWINIISEPKSHLSLFRLTNGDMREQLKMVAAIFNSPNYEWIKAFEALKQNIFRSISESKIFDLLVRGTNAICSKESPNFFINMFVITEENPDFPQNFTSTLNKIFILRILKKTGLINIRDLSQLLKELGHDSSNTNKSIEILLERNIIISPEGHYLESDNIESLYFTFDHSTLGPLYCDQILYNLYYLQAMAYITPLAPHLLDRLKVPENYQSDVESIEDRLKAASLLVKQIRQDEQEQLKFIENNEKAQKIMQIYELEGISIRLRDRALEQLELIRDNTILSDEKWSEIFRYFD